jgi:formate-dependent nitrite reductase membrane component NrfD
MEHGDINVVYSVEHQLPLIIYIGQYFFFTGLSAGSFVISVIATLLGRKEFKPIGKITAILAPALLIIAPINLIADLEQPLRFWHLMLYYNWTSPITYGSFLLTAYPIMGILYAVMVYTDRLHSRVGQSAFALEHRRHADDLPGVGDGVRYRVSCDYCRYSIEMV